MKLKNLFLLILTFGVSGLWIMFVEIYRRIQSVPRKPYDANETRPFVKMHFGRVYIFGVAAGNTSDKAIWDVFKVYGGTDLRGMENSTLTCCFKYIYRNKSIYMKVPAKYYRISGGLLKEFHVTCPNVPYKTEINPISVALTTPRLTCEEYDVQYVEPLYPKKEPGTKLAIHTKVAFGNIKAELIIEWMETYIYLGVDKVFSYYLDDLNNNAMKALRYYNELGILGLHHYEPAQSDLYRHDLSGKNGQAYADERLTIHDAFERALGYMYYGVINFDEFLIPSNNRSLKQMLADLFNEYPNAAGFRFLSQLYSLSWGPAGNKTDLIINSYINRIAQPPGMDRTKLLYKPSYTVEGSMSTHNVRTKFKKEIVTVPTEDGYLRHFRRCRATKDLSGLGCAADINRVLDTSLAEWSSCIRENVMKVRKRLFVNSVPVL